MHESKRKCTKFNELHHEKPSTHFTRTYNIESTVRQLKKLSENPQIEQNTRVETRLDL